MSKFCQNCGNVMEDQEVFCANCGAQNEVVNAGGAFDSIKEKLLNKKTGIIAGAAAVALVVVIVLCTVLGGGAKTAVKKAYDIRIKGKTSVIKALAPKEYWEFAEKAYDTDLSELKKDYKDDFDDEKDDDYKVSYKYQDKKEATRKQLKACKEFLSERYDIDEDKIKKLYIVDFTFKTKFEGDKDISTSVSYAVKIGSKWYAVDSDYDFIVNEITYKYKDEKAWEKYLEKNSEDFEDEYDIDYQDIYDYYD